MIHVLLVVSTHGSCLVRRGLVSWLLRKCRGNGSSAEKSCKDSLPVLSPCPKREHLDRASSSAASSLEGFNVSCSATSFHCNTVGFHFPPPLCMNAFNQDVWMDFTLDEKPGGRPKQSITSLRPRTSLSPYFLSGSVRRDVLSGSQRSSHALGTRPKGVRAFRGQAILSFYSRLWGSEFSKWRLYKGSEKSFLKWLLSGSHHGRITWQRSAYAPRHPRYLRTSLYRKPCSKLRLLKRIRRRQPASHSQLRTDFNSAQFADRAQSKASGPSGAHGLESTAASIQLLSVHWLYLYLPWGMSLVAGDSISSTASPNGTMAQRWH